MCHDFAAWAAKAPDLCLLALSSFTSARGMLLPVVLAFSSNHESCPLPFCSTCFLKPIHTLEHASCGHGAPCACSVHIR